MSGPAVCVGEALVALGACVGVAAGAVSGNWPLAAQCAITVGVVVYARWQRRAAEGWRRSFVELGRERLRRLQVRVTWRP